MNMPPWKSILIAATLASCTNGRPLDIRKIGKNEVLFSIPGDNGTRKSELYCITSAYIYMLPNKSSPIDEGRVVWAVELTGGMENCPLEMKFPDVPRGYKLKTPAKELAIGHYRIVVNGGVGYSIGDFDL
jgi:hypothetical protein